MMNESTEILRFHNATIAADSEHESGIRNLNASLAAGALAVVLLEKEQVGISLADAAEGLVTPAGGTVTFLGEDWQTMTPDHAAAQRGKIGRVFECESWLSDLDVDQDVTLAEQHHTHRPIKEIEEEAINLCHVFGLVGLPHSRPSSVPWQDLQKAACVRAFLGSPVLILLENPTFGTYTDLIAPLIVATHDACRRGAAVLWTTTELQIWNHPEMLATARWRMLGSRTCEIEQVGEATE
jgi:phospholipid/cholesterol/gamma-HCH transport system ATP-binding protein